MNRSDLQNILAKSGSAFFYTPPAGITKAVSWLLNNPEEILTADSKTSLKRITVKAEKLIKSGLTGVFIADYESVYFIEKKLNIYNTSKASSPVKILLYRPEDVISIPSAEFNLFDIAAQDEYLLKKFIINISKEKYIQKVNLIRDLIEEGETYQVNYTVKGKFEFEGNPFALFCQLLFNQSAPYSAFINDEDNFILSLSPELFFSVEGDRIITKPMKGTIKRTAVSGRDDKFQSEILRNSEKEKSENLMIVDLLRNDLGRICRYGTVQTSKLFHIEKYETLLQMVSEIQGSLPETINLNDIITNIFPCGSVTGAPKLRTMEIIKELEEEDRGIYTGSIGLLLKEKKVFNVAIRTLKINKKSGNGEVGLGSGIVWDSQPEAEYNEVILKSDFITKPIPVFYLFETFLLADGKFLFEEEHLKRMEDSADYFLFNYNRKKVKNVLKNASKKNPEGKFKARLSLSKEGNTKVDVLDYSYYEEIKVVVSDKKINSGDKFLYHKTSNRNLYNNEHSRCKEAGFFDVIFFNEKDELCEGAVSNIFISKGDKWYTPEVSSGLLPGVYRDFLIKNLPGIVESKLFMDDLINADEIMLVNSVRGRTIVQKIFLPKGKIHICPKH